MYWGSGGTAPCILDFGIPWPLYPQGKSPWYPLDRRPGGPQTLSGCSGEEKNSRLLPGLKPLIIQPTAQC